MIAHPHLKNSLFRTLIAAVTGLALSSCYYFESPDIEDYRSHFKTQTQPIGKGALSVTFLGTSSLLFSDGETTLLTDGFLTRPEDRMQVLFGKIKTDKPKLKRYLDKLKINKKGAVDAIMIFHSHYDHAMDAPEIAKYTGAKVLGSSSTAMISKGANLPEDQIVTVDSGKVYRFGKFKVRMIRSVHTPLPWFINMMGSMGTIEKPVTQPASTFDYKEGGTYSIVIEHPLGNSMVHGGAFIKGAMKDVKVDTIFMCVPGISSLGEEKETYYKEVVKGTGAQRIVPVHWDDFSKSLDQPLQLMPRYADNLDPTFEFLFGKQKKNPELKIQFLPAWQKTQLFPYE